MKKLTIGNLSVSSDLPPLIIPEIGINHFGSLSIAKKLVDKAHLAGAKIIKTQTHIPDDEMSIEAKFIKPGNSNKSIYKIIKDSSLNLEHEESLKKYVESKGLVYLSTPFCIPAANFLNEIGVKAFKIGSGEFSNFPLIKTIAKFKKPMILSSGMHSFKTINTTNNLLKKLNIDYVINYCVNLYPTPLEKINLKDLNFIKKKNSKGIVGYSDHSSGLAASILSFFYNSNLVEKHFCLDKKSKGPDIPCSMDPYELKLLIKMSKEIFNLKSVNKTDLLSQKITKDFAFHSLVASTNMYEGQIISLKHIEIKRPGNGDFSSNEISKILGKKIKKKLLKNNQFKKENVK